MQSSPKNSPAPTKPIVASFPCAEMTVTLAAPSARFKSEQLCTVFRKDDGRVLWDGLLPSLRRSLAR